MKNNEMLSLYDYLGHAAGSELGRQVAYQAAKEKVSHDTRYVKNPAYEGEVYLYPKSFLEKYFNKSKGYKMADKNELPF